MPGQLNGLVVLLTGVTAGIGRSTARALVDEGATVIGCARDAERLDVVRQELPSLDVVTCDVRDAAQRAQLVDGAIARHGRIDVLVNNAGVGRVGWLAEMTADDIDDVFETNAIAYADLTRLVLPHMLERGSGQIVMISSSAAWVSIPPLTLYAASKHAVAGLVQGLRSELKGTNVLLHTINPGPVETEFPARSAGYEPSEDEDETRKPSPLAVSPERIADAVLKCLRSSTPQTIAVPRPLALAQFAHVPVVGPLIEMVVGQAAPYLVEKGRQIVRERVPAGRA